MQLFKIQFMNGEREAYTQAWSINDAVARVMKALKDSAYTPEEAKICGVQVLANQTWPGVFGG